MKYSLVIFDMDGTTLDTLQDLTDSMNHVLSVFSMPPRSREEVRGYMGNGLRRLAELAVPDNTPAAVVDRVFSALTAYYPNHCSEKTCPYDGILPLLRRLRDNGIATALVSNKIDCAVQELCSVHFPGLLDCAVGEKAGVRKKPHPDGVLHVLHTLGKTAEEAVYVGDTEVDIQTAVQAGMDCIGVDWGFRDRETVAELHPTYLVSSPEEIFSVVSE